MARPKIPSQKKAYAQLRGRINQYTLLVQQIYDQLNKEVASMVTRLGYDGSKPFRFSDYPQTSKAVRDLQEKFVGNLHSVIYTSTSREWKESNLLQDLLADKAMKFYGIKTRKGRIKKYYQTNSDALKAFQERKDKGLNLSQKLWNQSEDYKKELECAISSAMQKGTSAIALSKRLSKYLNDFPSLKADYGKRFGKARDVKDCEYRSIRLARTEINMAYRTAEQKRWEQFDFVIGYEVKLSGGHKIKDICDFAKGKYPKKFKFKGWHPNCFCYVIPILKSEDEFWDESGEPCPSEVVDTPDGFKDWIKDNKDRLSDAKKKNTLPYWAEENASIIDEILNEKYVFSKSDRLGLIENGFKPRGLISVEGYNNGPMSGFDIVHFDRVFEEIFDQYEVMLRKKELSNSNSFVSLVYNGKSSNGESVDFLRYFKFEEIEGKKQKVVYHELFDLSETLQNKGISKSLFRELIPQYEEAGIVRAYIRANKDVGSLCWSKYGALANKHEIEFLAKKAKSEGLISKDDFEFIQEYLSRFDKMVPMQDLAYASFGENLLLGKGKTWNGYIDLKDEAQREYLHRYLGIK